MTGAAAAVEVDGLVKHYGDRTVLDGVSFSVAPGEVLALLGPNGAGKTTTVEILEGYRTADGGRVRILGEDPAGGSPALRARVGLMLQGGGGVDPRATPRDVLALYAGFHAPARGVEELLGTLGLRAVAETRHRRLSGGERQRLALALALVGNPDVLLLDEPTGGMDPAVRSSVRSLIRDLAAAGAAILLTTHDLGDVERAADRVAILDGGRLVALGTPSALVAGGERMLRVRFETTVDAAGLAAHLAARLPAARVEGDGSGELRVTGMEPDPALVAAVAGWAAGAGSQIAELRTAAATLEERYLELTGDAAVEHGE